MPLAFSLRESRFQRGPRQQPFKNPPERPAQTHLDLGHAQQVSRALAHPLQVHVVDPDHLAPVNVDDLAVHQVLGKIKVVALVL